jgi:23S rRNA pseudouridine1911/1915/1917 synthase
LVRIPILLQDDHILVVDKPARMLVVPAPGRQGPCLVDVLGRQIGRRVFAVHRLDEDVTGVLVLSVDPESRGSVEAVFREHRARRIYLALLSRAPDPAAGKIESLVREFPGGVVRSVLHGPGDRAVTVFRVLRRVGRNTLVECELETGRRNQIRVHMSDLKCPIVGDRKYGFRGSGPPRRPLLHAQMRLSVSSVSYSST